ncbi:MAG TPA: acyltransferase domain-containing protein [Micromonosporaceae bacterium]|nr:acyltransferase domain-containing protein [Micromonosporaceae bacterium]
MAAACVAGMLSLDDGARIVARRSQALRGLAGTGAMASVAAGPERVAGLLAGLGQRAGGVVVAAVNGACSTVVSGPPDRVAVVVTAAEAEGLRARTVDVDYASHSPDIDQVTGELTAALHGISPNTTPVDVAFYSTVTTAATDAAELDTGYWVTNLRQPVRFADTIRTLLDHGHRIFIEVSTHPVLTLGIQETAEQLGIDAATVPTLRRDQGDQAQLARALAQAFTAGVPVDWTRWFPGDPAPQVVDLPTYAFQRQWFWLAGGRGGDGGGHPVLGRAVELASGDGLMWTGRLGVHTYPWLADHRMSGVAVVPGTALVEWALWAGDEAGCDGVEELVFQAPLALPASGSVQVQVTVDAPGKDGHRGVRIYSREDAGDAGGWMCHAVGVLRAGPADPVTGRPQPDARHRWDGRWPGPGAQPVALEGFYEHLAAAGYEYGPAFAGVRAVWRDGSDLLAEVSLPEAAGGGEGMGVHPALLDAVLHPVLLLGEPAGDGAVWLPFTWSGVCLWATRATVVRVRLSMDGRRPDERGLRVVMADPDGSLVLTADAVLMRPAARQQLRAAVAGRSGHRLYTVAWAPLPLTTAEPAVEPAGEPDRPDEQLWVLLGQDHSHPDPAGAVRLPDLPALTAALDAGTPSPAAVLVGLVPTDPIGLDTAHTTLALLRDWLAEPRLVGTQLVIVTRNAVSTGDRALIDPASAAAWGLVRSVQAEHPDRFTLLDLDPGTPPAAAVTRQALTHAHRSGEPQVAVRDGQALVPRLAPLSPSGDDIPGVNPDGTVLIIGGAGGLATLVAEHVVRAWQVKHLILAIGHAPDARDAVARLGGLGAQVRLTATDMTDAAAVAGLVAGADPEHPLTGVIHAADPADATGLHHLHAATVDRPLDLFLVLSDAVAAFGSPGYAHRAAADAYGAALAAHRHATGHRGLSLAWGPPTQPPEHLDRCGVAAMSGAEMVGLLDAACRHGGPQLLAVNVDARVLAAHPVHRQPALLRGLTTPSGGRRGRRVAVAGGERSVDWADRLAGLSADERHRVVLDLVRRHAATVLRRNDPDAMRADASFKELGFESLTAVELRDRLAAATGLRLPAALIFRYPSPKGLADHLLQRLSSGAAAPSDQHRMDSILDELARLESALSGVAPENGDSRVVTARLESLLARWKAAHRPADEASVAEQLRSASTDQVLDFVENLLGVA